MGLVTAPWTGRSGPNHPWEGNGQRGSRSDSETARTRGVGKKNELALGTGQGGDLQAKRSCRGAGMMVPGCPLSDQSTC